ncbi:MAG: substrate-binding domain-containing protein [Candidatus Marinimicrobia bacterium]|nr:substrate-binding domain-containing protein [Candidatus Neomarinimicrobiota bacterium]
MERIINNSLLSVIIAGLIVLGTFGCQRGKQSDADGPTVAFVMKTMNNPFFIDMQRGAKEAADKFGINLLVQAAEREVDVEKQMQIIENLIQRKVDVICVTPSGSKEIIPAIVKANQANIPVIIVDTRVDAEALKESGGKTAGFIGSDNVDGGRIAGLFIIEQLGGIGKIAILEGIPGHETGDARLKGFHEALASQSGITLVASQTANWERDQGYNVFQNILQSHPGVQALFACNDMMALGAVEAISAMGKTGEVVVVGFDAITDGRRAIAEKRMSASIAQHPYDMGKVALEKAWALLQGQIIPAEIPVKIELITAASLTNN